MPCYRPLKAYRSREKNPATGRYLVTFNPVKNLIEGSSLELPCGACDGCRMERSRQWAMRCMHEAQMHPQNSFITLTFSDEHLPENYSVSVRDWQLFMKRLRKSLHFKKIRFYAVGEYGDEFFRPHYHALLFNHDFADKVLFKKERGNKIYTSLSLSQIWPFGHASTADVTYQSAAYVARYVMKKINGPAADDYYWRVNPHTQTLVRQAPEFSVMSRRPGIGKAWFDKYKADAFPSDFLIVDGKKHKPPQFYLKLLAEDEQTKTKRARKRIALQRRADNTPARRAVREELHALRIKQLKRTLKE